jgi:hypothetical protein
MRKKDREQNRVKGKKKKEKDKGLWEKIGGWGKGKDKNNRQ